MTKILVTGATGDVGSRVIRHLRARGEDVRAFVRGPGKAAGRLVEGVDLAFGDFSRAASVRRAVEGVESVFVACANDPRQVEYETCVIDAAREAGVRRTVKLSALGAETGSPVAFWDWHARIEDHLRASGIPAVMLRPAFNMTNLLGSAGGVRRAGSLFAPADGARIAMIHPADIAAVAAAALTTEGHDGQTYVLTGPEAITFERAAGELSAATGRQVQFVAVPDEAARQALVGSGIPESTASEIVAVFGFLRRGAHERPTGSVLALTGREPRTFARFAREHAGLFRAGSEEPAGVQTSG